MYLYGINGSPHGAQGRTGRLLSVVLQGAEDAGARVGRAELGDLHIEACSGCHHCWKAGPGTCVIQDDFGRAAAGLAGSGVVVLASPLHFLHISGQLKVFIDRMTSLGGDPHRSPRPHGGSPGVAASERTRPRLLALSTAGFPEPEIFASLDHWMRALAGLLGMEYAGGLFLPGAAILDGGTEGDRQGLAAILDRARALGGALARGEALP